MKYKILLSGHSKIIINEFFTFMDSDFECMSCSDRYADIVNHIKYVDPDVFVYCFHGERTDDLKKFVNVETKLSEAKVPIAVIGDSADCEQFTKYVPFSGAVILRKPISFQQIEAAVLKLAEGRKKHAQGEETTAASETDLISSAKKLLEELENLEPDGGAAKQTEKSPEPEKAAEGVKTTESGGRKHILVVDDDSSVLKLIKSHLSDRYDVATAINAKVALKFLENKRTDMILLDYEMPGENGAYVLRKIRNDERLKDLPVVFLTGVTDRERIRQVVALNPQGYLLKPIDMGRLDTTIQEILV